MTVRRSCAALVLLLIAIAGCAPSRPASDVLPLAAPGHPAYDGTVTVEPDSHRLQAQWRIRFVCSRAEADSATLLLNPGLRLSRLTGPEVLGFSRTAGDPDRITVQLGPAARADRESEIDLEYEGAPRFGSDSINNIGPRWVALGLDSFWQPVFDDFGQTIVGGARVVLPRGWEAAASGVTGAGRTAHLVRNRLPLPDVAFSASPAFRVAEVGAIRVYHVGAPEAMVSRTLATTLACADYLNALFRAGPPLPPLSVVLAPRQGPGYARKNYIVITAGADTAEVPLLHFLCHEEAHYWATGANASGPEHWLNEGLAEYLAGRAVRALAGAEAYGRVVAHWERGATGQPFVWSDTATRRPEPRVAYAKAPYLLDVLERRIGPATMDTLLARFLLRPERTTPALIEALRSVSDDGTTAWFRGELAR